MHGERVRLFFCGLLLGGVCLVVLLTTSDQRLLSLTGNTLWLCVGTCLISVPIGTGLALLLARTDMPLRRSMVLCVAVLLVLPLAMHAAAWDAGFGKLGWYSFVRQSIGAPLLHGWVAALWIHAIWSTAWVVLIVAAALRLAEPELEEDALLNGTAWQVFRSVTLRRAAGGVVVAAIWVTLATASEMTVTDLYQIRTLAEEIYTGFALADAATSTFGLGAALLFTGVLSGLTWVVLDRAVVAAEHIPARPARPFRLGRWRWPVAIVVAGSLMILVSVPLGSLMYQAGVVVDQVDGRIVRSWSPGRLAELLFPLPSTYDVSVPWRYRESFIWTILIGGSAATIALAVAVPLAWLARRGGTRSLPAVGVVSLAMATMGPLVGLAVIWLFTRGDQLWVVWLYDRTILAPVLAATWRCLPLPVLICWFAFGSLNETMVDAARVEGAGPIARLFHAGVAQRKAALVTAWILALVVACAEMSATILVVPPGVRTVPIRVFGLVHAGVSNQVAAICLVSILGYGLLAAALVVIGRITFRRASGPAGGARAAAAQRGER